MDNLWITAEGEGHPCPPDGTPTPPGGGHPRPTSHTPKQTRTEKVSKRHASGKEAGEPGWVSPQVRAELVGMIATYMHAHVPTLFAMVSHLVDEHTAGILWSSSTYSGASSDEWSAAVDYYGPRVRDACGVELATVLDAAELRDQQVVEACHALRDRVDDLTRADVAAALLEVSADTRAAADDLRAAVAGAAAWSGQHPSGNDG